MEFDMELTLEMMNLNAESRAALAINFALSAADVFEKKYPGTSDSILMEAINLATLRLVTGETESTAEFERILRACYEAGDMSAPHQAAASYAAYSAGNALDCWSLSSAAYSAYYAGEPTGFIERCHSFIHCRLHDLLPLILRYKIENGGNFNNPEEVLRNLSGEDKSLFEESYMKMNHNEAGQ